MFSPQSKSYLSNSRSEEARHRMNEEAAHSYPPSSQNSSSQDESSLLVESNHTLPFLLSTDLMAPSAEPKATTFFGRVLDIFKGKNSDFSSSFVLASIGDSVRFSQPDDVLHPAQGTTQNPPYVTMLTYRDQTPLFTFRSTTGLLQIDSGLERQSDVDISFWIAVTLTYLDYLHDREVSDYLHISSASVSCIIGLHSSRE